MTIPTNDLINYDGIDWGDYLKKICLYDVFKDIVEEYQNDPETLTGLIRYITWTYSLDSNKIVLRQEWVINKRKIFKATGLLASMEDEIVFLKNKTVLYTAKKWLLLQDDENWSTLTMLNDLIAELRVASNSPILKSTGEVDYKTKVECAESVIELLSKKAEVEQKFIQNNDKLKEAYKDVSQANNKQGGNTMGVETMLKERSKNN